MNSKNKNVQQDKKEMEKLVTQEYIPFDMLNEGNNRIEKAKTFSIPLKAAKQLNYLSGNSEMKLYITLLTITFSLLRLYNKSDKLSLVVPEIRQGNPKQGDVSLLELSVNITRNIKFYECLDEVKKVVKESIIDPKCIAKKSETETYYSLTSDKNQKKFGVVTSYKGLHDNIDPNRIQYDLLIEWKKENNQIIGKINYDSSKYYIKTINRIIENLINITNKLIENRENNIGNMPLLLKDEIEAQCKISKGKKINYPSEENLISLFQKQAAITPNRKAITYAEVSYSYLELDNLSDNVAANIKKKKIDKQSPIGLNMTRSAEMVIAILGILKSGHSYLPLDIYLPDKRKEYIINKSEIKIMISDHSLSRNYGVDKCNYWDIVKRTDEVNNTNYDIKPTDIAYVIFTSGTSGKPKGVTVAHKSVVNLIWGLKSEIFSKLPEYLQIGMLSSHNFDASVQIMFPSLVLGHTLHVAKDEVRAEGKNLWGFLEDKKIQLSDATPSHLKLMNNTSIETNLQNLKMIIVGGEKFNNSVRKKFLNKLGNETVEIVNAYGPTECTVQSSHFIVPSEWDEESIPIGNPMPNEEVYVCDEYNNLVPKGVFGELYISGDGISEGYINDEKLTKKKFVKIPELTDSLLYKTGDVVRWRNDNLLEFANRNDNQVKIRGHRIELDEIKNTLLKFKEKEQLIKDAVVTSLSTSSSGDFICAYFQSNEKIDINEIRSYMQKTIPNYMVPKYFIQLEKFPLNLSGKIDTNTLPDPRNYYSNIEVNLKNERTRGEDDIEGKIIDLFSEILELPQEYIKVNESFFDLGGSSFNIVELSNKISEKFDKEITAIDLFQYTTVREISLLIKENKTVASEVYTDGNDNEDQLESIIENIRGDSDG